MPSSIILREDPKFLRCNECGTVHPVAEVERSILTYGVVYVDCDETIFQGYTCPSQGCFKTTATEVPAANPVVDLRNFILVPQLPFKGPSLQQHINESLYEEFYRKIKSPYLNYKRLPAWSPEFPPEFFHTYYEEPAPENFGYLLFTRKLAIQRVHEENKENGKIQLRRLYEDNEKNRALLKSLSQNYPVISKSSIASDDGRPNIENYGKAFDEFLKAWIKLFFHSTQVDIAKKIRDTLKEKGINKEITDKELLFLSRLIFLGVYGDLAKDPVRKSLIYKYLNNHYKLMEDDTIIQQTLSFFWNFPETIYRSKYIESKREELSQWQKAYGDGKALFVNSPLGLGKSFSFIDFLTSQENVSAILFLPTKILCEEIYGKMVEHFLDKRESDETIITEEEILAPDRTKEYRTIRDLPKFGIYFYEGITREECYFFDEIIKLYAVGLKGKKPLCEKCPKKYNCRFLVSPNTLQKYRIILTTHAQYDRIFQDTRFHYYHAPLGEDHEEMRKRDLFVIDEDFVFSKCYQPITKNFDDFLEQSGSSMERIKDVELPPRFREDILRFFGKISLCFQTSVVNPIGKDFELPDALKSALDFYEKEIEPHDPLPPAPERLVSPIRQCFELIEVGMKFGVVVQKFKMGRQKQHSIIFPNTTEYDLSNLPPHVFFDGTAFDQSIIERKLKGVKYEEIKIPFDNQWSLKVWQNRNTDVSKSELNKDNNSKDIFQKKTKNEEEDEIPNANLLKKLEILIGDFLCHQPRQGTRKIGPEVLLISNKDLRNKFTDKHKENWKIRTKNEIHCVNFGMTKGINSAQSCKLGFMLGSYTLSDAVEIAMALPFIQDELEPDVVLRTQNNFWTWKTNERRRRYKEEFQIIEKLSRNVRFAEQRQAMGRTRYITHNVEFVVLSKDRVDEYERFAEVVDDNFREDLFPPLPPPQSSEYEPHVREACEMLIGEINEGKRTSFKLADVEKIVRPKMKITRLGTVGKWLKRLEEEGKITLKGKSYYLAEPPLEADPGKK